MLELITLGVLAVGFSALSYNSYQEPPGQTPGLSSQRSQIKPLTTEQINLGKKAYLGPPKPRGAEFYRSRRVNKAVRKLPF